MNIFISIFDQRTCFLTRHNKAYQWFSIASLQFGGNIREITVLSHLEVIKREKKGTKALHSEHSFSSLFLRMNFPFLLTEHSITLFPSRIEQPNSTLWAPYLLWLSEQKFPYFLTEHSIALFPSRIEQPKSILWAPYLLWLSENESPVLTHWALYSSLSISHWATKFYSLSTLSPVAFWAEVSVLSHWALCITLFPSRIEQPNSSLWASYLLWLSE